jgi:Na+/proline symporter
MNDLRYPRRYRDADARGFAHYDERALSRAAIAWTAIAWTAMALCLAIILSIAFGTGHEPKRFAANDQTLLIAQKLTPPAAPAAVRRP